MVWSGGIKMKCPNCGHDLLPGAKFCGHCGYHLGAKKMTTDKINQSRNSNELRCPRCGHKLLKGAKFCGHCGYRFDSKDLKNDATNSATMNYKPHNISNQSVVPSRKVLHSKNANHKNLKLICLVILIVLVCGGAGYFGYTHFINPANGGQKIAKKSAKVANKSKKSTQPAKLTKKTAANNLKGLWSTVKSTVNSNDEGNMSSYFVNGTSNSGYKELNKWAHMENDVTTLGSVNVVPVVKSVTSKNGTVIVKYNVNYTFNHKSHKTHYQTFMWVAQYKRTNNTWKLTSNKANNKPIYNKVK